MYGGQQFGFDLVAHQRRFDHIHIVGAALDVIRHGIEQGLEFGHGEVAAAGAVHRFETAAARHFTEIEFGRLDAGQALHPLTEGVEAHQLRLHLAEAARHQRQVFFQEFVFIGIFAAGGAAHQFAHRRRHAGSIAEYKIGQEGGAEYDRQYEGDKQRQQMPTRQRD
ncbi:hypothetical protein D3C81_1567630 [compost metagenome]